MSASAREKSCESCLADRLCVPKRVCASEREQTLERGTVGRCV